MNGMKFMQRWSEIGSGQFCMVVDGGMVSGSGMVSVRV